MVGRISHIAGILPLKFPDHSITVCDHSPVGLLVLGRSSLDMYVRTCLLHHMTVPLLVFVRTEMRDVDMRVCIAGCGTVANLKMCLVGTSLLHNITVLCCLIMLWTLWALS